MRPADIGLVGALIASVHPAGTRTDAARTVPLDGRLVAPGLIDTHLHIESSMVTPREYAAVGRAPGDHHHLLGPARGGQRVGAGRRALGGGRPPAGLPLRVLVLAPSSVPSAPGLELAGACFDAAEMEEMLRWPDVAGVAEVMTCAASSTAPHACAASWARGAHPENSCAATRATWAPPTSRPSPPPGIESDHEITSGDDLLEKLRCGYTVELRASHDKRAARCSRGAERAARHSADHTLCTDDILPDVLSSAAA